MKKILTPFLVLGLFIVVFFLTTAITDTIDHWTGYYDEGLKEAAEIGQ